MVASMATFFIREFPEGQVLYMDNLKPLDKKLGSENSNLRHYFVVVFFVSFNLVRRTNCYLKDSKFVLDGNS